MVVCARQMRNTRYGNWAVQTCMYVRYGNRYPLPPGEKVTIHFNQLVVAEEITIRRQGLLTLCEVDVLGTEVVLAPEG